MCSSAYVIVSLLDKPICNSLYLFQPTITFHFIYINTRLAGSIRMFIVGLNIACMPSYPFSPCQTCQWYSLHPTVCLVVGVSGRREVGRSLIRSGKRQQESRRRIVSWWKLSICRPVVVYGSLYLDFGMYCECYVEKPKPTLLALQLVERKQAVE